MNEPSAEPDWRALADGRPESVAALFDRHGAALLLVARAITGSRSDAEDAVQQTFLDLHRSRHALARAVEPRGYVYRTLRNAALRIRARRREDALDEVDREPEDRDRRPEEHPELERALARLPAEQREVVALKVDAELTFAEIGAALGLSPNTASSRYRYALERLRDELGGRA